MLTGYGVLTVVPEPELLVELLAIERLAEQLVATKPSFQLGSPLASMPFGKGARSSLKELE
jgi:hypothetical protein